MRLIINADDLGINPQRSHGIFQAFEHGILTSASLVVNGQGSDAAARRAGEKGLPIGLHLNLTEGSPLSELSTIPSLLTTDGYLLGREALSASLRRGTIERTHIEREIRAQLEWFLDCAGQPTHVDSHHHVHVLPELVELLIPILDRYSINFVRIPREPLPPFGYEIDEEKLKRASAISSLATAAEGSYAAHGIRSTDHFRGLALSGHCSMRNIRHTIARLQEGTTELMTHPGSANPGGSPFDADPQRQTELNMLLDPASRELLSDRDIELISWGGMY